MAKKIIQRIDGVLKHISLVKKEMGSISFEDFKMQTLLPDAISFNLAQIGERMNKLEEILKDSYPNLPWKEARRMRNIIVHDYDRVNFELVYKTAMNDLPVLRIELQKVKDDINHTSEKTLVTERLLLRPWTDFDALELFELANEPEIGFWCGWEPHKHIRDSLFVLHNFLENNEIYAICLKDSATIIGSIGLHSDSELVLSDNEYELGYWIGKTYWNNGYATEAANELIRHAFEDLGATIIWCGYYDGNERSRHVQEKLGFEHHHFCENVEVSQLKTVRKGYTNILTKEKWELISKK